MVTLPEGISSRLGNHCDSFLNGYQRMLTLSVRRPPRATANSRLTLLGLTQDDSQKHAERIKFWDNFNVCWLALLQRQKDDTEQMLDSGRPPARPQSLLAQESLEEMGNELVSLCDGLEKHGLVDYQMGVSEQEIIESEPKSLPNLSRQT